MKFSVGEVVVYSPNPADVCGWRGVAGPGAECELVEPCQTSIGPGWLCHFPGDPSPYRIDGHWRVPERHLRKRPYKDQHTPAEQSFGELISWANGQSEWTPKTSKANQEESR